ncbi:MAG TPA: aminotransferase class V-fold PLP-dependent enzyme [Ktedonobacteraceae bacterium]|jgi:molybdenum cofactor sulfurtransferase|nr:aminotransferase class V-fold PLP-dependent enzyme [Ktedonobacteraceae bacterium]
MSGAAGDTRSSLSIDLVKMQQAEQAFRQGYPSFESTSLLDDLRETEYVRLDDLEHIYLDYTGGGLYADSQLREHFELLRHNVFGNPHSLNPTSRAMTELVERARASVLSFFHASPDEYAVIFTSNASNALKLVGEAYPFQDNGQFLLLFDNHNSVNGIREFARAKGASFTYLPVMAPELRAEEDLLFSFLDSGRQYTHPLFAYPAQSNFTGVQHPLEWIEAAQARGWDVLLDAAAFVPTNRLDLSQWHPDFVPLSFYKMFGYPTGVGCLLARKASLAKLQRPWFAGGTVWGISVQGDGYVMLSGGEGFEDGTVNYLNLPAVEIGLKHLETIGMETIHERVRCLTGWLLDALLSLRHSNGQPLIEVYGPHDTTMRGGTIALNFLDPDGTIIDERVVDRRASEIRLSLRTGCFCNPGAGEAAFNLSKESLYKIFHEKQQETLPQLFRGEKGMTWDEFLADLGMQSGGAVRVSLGLATNFADVYRLVQFARTFQDTFPGEIDLPPRLHC